MRASALLRFPTALSFLLGLDMLRKIGLSRGRVGLLVGAMAACCGWTPAIPARAAAPQRDLNPAAHRAATQTAAVLAPGKLFARDNLFAWCIVPYDAKKRGPEARAAMLERLGFRKFAYDYRAEHIGSFDAEMDALAKHNIELIAWWFPGELNDEAKHILEVLQRHHLHPALWVTGGGGPTATAAERAARIEQESNRLRPIALAAAEIGCRVDLYNHEGWFGEPENELALLAALKLPNVGMVYNLHHGHDQLDRLPKILKQMLPHLDAISLNGMVRHGNQSGEQILPLGQGDLDLSILRAICESGYRGPIGILGHTPDDAEQRLQDNLDGLDWLVKQLSGQPAGPRPKPRTPVPPRTGDISAGPAAALKKAGSNPAGSSEAAASSNRLELAAVDPSELCGGVSSITTMLPVEYDASMVAKVIAAAQQDGDAARGLDVFCSSRFACLQCHRVGRFGGAVGPALADVGRRAKAEEIVESVFWPKRTVKPEYSAWRFLLTDGRTLLGYKRGETVEAIELFDPATDKTARLAKSEIEAAHETGTLMPDGVAAAMSDRQRVDLTRFLLELGKNEALAARVRPETVAAPFTFSPAPLVASDWPLSGERVNRDRVYDFYRKEALFFRGQADHPHLLPAFPELDGGKYGHWGNQNEESWKDGRWANSDLGNLLCGVFRKPGGPIPKGVCLRLGDNGELSACFNPETLCYEALWHGGFIKFTNIRHGFLDGLNFQGELLPVPAEKKPDQPFVYHGFYRAGKRVVFSYRVGDQEWLDSPWVKDGQLERIVAPAAEHPLRAALHGAAPQWPQEFKTKIIAGTGHPYAVDTIELPVDNPWKQQLFFGDHAFLPDGSALLCTMEGDVWHVTGLEPGSREARWRRFASGLHQPLGMIVSEGQIYVLGRDQITRLHDLNGDGEADFYECFSNKMRTSAASHDFICGLVRDPQGRFYTASGAQGLIRISADGDKVDVLATGFRNPDGVGLCPDGAVTLPCSEGDWTPASMLCLIKPDSTRETPPYFGYGGPKGGKPPALPFVYLPRGMDNSSGGQITVPDDRWGPLKGQMIHFSYGQGSHFLLLRDEVDGQAQGAVVPLVGDFRSGSHRGKFNPQDGQLYVSGMGGWGTYTPDDGCFQRIRYTGEKVQLPRSIHTHENGVLISFTQPVDPKALEKRSNHFAQVWNYRYSPSYGSQEYSPCHAGAIGHEVLPIAGVHLIDPQTVFVELPALQPVNQLHLLLQVDEGRPQELVLTVHRLDKPFTNFAGYTPQTKLIAAHPMQIDLARLGKQLPNPWTKSLPQAVPLQIAAGNNLTYSTRTLRAKPGENVKLTFQNPDVVPHNWVLLKPGKLKEVGEQANRLIADPQAYLHQYVPENDAVLVYTDIVPGGQEFSIYFQAPREKGRYPYLCTFPGHWMVMNGELIVE
ncbi:MAG TPA: DUF6797 domain-containing protein [Pirellulales bacterium]|nr:DUF6797 domain-containing protein [Pirellulales bacterium]